MTLEHLHKLIEEISCIDRTRSCFGMELYGEEGFGFVAYTFDAVIIGVSEPDVEIFGQSFFIHSEAVIL